MKNSAIKTLKFYFKKIGKYKLLSFGLILCITLAIFFSMSWAIVFRDFIATLTSEGSREVIGKALFSTLLIIMAVESAEFIFWRLAGFINNYFQPKIMSDIANECFDNLHQHSYKFFSNNFAGSLVKKVTRLVGSFEAVADKLYWDILPLILRITIITGVLFYLSPKLGTIMLVWTLFFMGINYAASMYKLKFDLARSKADTQVTAYLADTITNNTNIKLFANSKFENQRFQLVTFDWFKKMKKSWDIASFIDAIQTVLMVVLEFLIIYTAIQLWVDNQLQAADFFIIQSYLIEAFHQLWNFGRVIRDLYEKLTDGNEMVEILNTPIEIQDSPKAKKIKITAGAIEFQNVSFTYNKKQAVLKDLSIKIKPSEKIALIGPSGGGKSTITKLILRLFDITKGQILIDNQNIQLVTQDSLRHQICLVPQDPILFHRTLFENIKYGNPKASKAEVEAAAKLAYCHDFITQFPKGYETLVGERGIKLSGGERQRIAIARAILVNAPILILDEATSSLDSESEHLIQKALANLLKNKTAIIVAHRLSTIQSVDRILVVSKGQIKEQGSHAELLQKHGGTYQKLWNLQVGGYTAT